MFIKAAAICAIVYPPYVSVVVTVVPAPPTRVAPVIPVVGCTIGVLFQKESNWLVPVPILVPAPEVDKTRFTPVAIVSAVPLIANAAVVLLG